MASVAERILDIITEEIGFHKEQVSLTDSLADDLGMDSLDAVELIGRIEEEFGMEIPNKDAEKILTVQDMVDYVSKHMSADARQALKD